MSWDDRPLPEDAEIKAAFPTRSGRHDLYAEAMRLVGARHSKAGLVELVTWLLLKAEAPPIMVKKPNDCTIAGCNGERIAFKLFCPKHVPAEPITPMDEVRAEAFRDAADIVRAWERDATEPVLTAVKSIASQIEWAANEASKKT